MATRDTLTTKEAQCSGGADYAALALEALQEPADAAYAKELMDRVAGDCQFTKDLAACAIVYKALGEQDRAEELLQTAEDYCMSGEEQVALAEAKFKVLGDKAAAVGAYEKALKETGNLDPLIDLAKNVMSVMADSAFAKKVLETAEAKISRAVEYSKLAAASAEHLLDKDYAAAIFTSSIPRRPRAARGSWRSWRRSSSRGTGGWPTSTSATGSATARRCGTKGTIARWRSSSTAWRRVEAGEPMPDR